MAGSDGAPLPRVNEVTGLVVSYVPVEVVNQCRESIDFECQLPKFPEDAVSGVQGLEKFSRFH